LFAISKVIFGFRIATMFEFASFSSPPPKCFVSHGTLPAYFPIDVPPSSVRRPFSIIASHVFQHSLEVLIPKVTYDRINPELSTLTPELRYASVYFPLSFLLADKFYTRYLSNASSNIQLLSEVSSDYSQSSYALHDKKLILMLSREAYETTGLQGKPTRFGSGHLKRLWRIEIDFTLPSMRPGKHQWKRVEWAFKNALNESVRWICADPDDLGLKDSNILTGEHAVFREPLFIAEGLSSVLVPRFNDIQLPTSYASHDNTKGLEECSFDIYEQLSLISLGSARAQTDHNIDPYLCQFESSIPLDTTELVKLRWSGFLTSTWVSAVFIALLRIGKIDEWIWLSVHGFKHTPVSWIGDEHAALGNGENSYAILKLPYASYQSTFLGVDVNLNEQQIEGEEKDRKDKKERNMRAPYLSWEIIDAWDGHS
jgi:ribonuclease P/MRP protein subunit RPP40